MTETKKTTEMTETTEMPENDLNNWNDHTERIKTTITTFPSSKHFTIFFQERQLPLLVRSQARKWAINKEILVILLVLVAISISSPCS